MNLNREIIRLAGPAIVSNIAVPLLGLSDTTIAGHLGSEEALAAIGAGAMMVNASFWLFGFLRMGTTGITAQAYGQGRMHQAMATLARSFWLAASIGLVIVALHVPLRGLLLAMMAPPGPSADLASIYFTTVIFSAPAILCTMSVLGWLLGMQNTSLPMAISIAPNIINIALSLTLVFGFDLGFRGIAIGTLASNWFALALALVLAARFSRRKGCRLSLSLKSKGDAEPALHGMGRFFKVNTDIFFRSVCIMAVSLSVTAFGARLGPLTLAANSVMMQFFTLFAYFMDGFAFTGEALCGRFAGEMQRGSADGHKMLMRSVRALLWWSAGCAAVFFTAYLVAGMRIAGLITDEPEVLAAVGEYYPFLVAIPPITVAAFIFDGFYIGLTRTRKMLVATAISAALFYAISLSAGTLPSNPRRWTAFLA
ncbi:MAG: MATE family efflux transporter, partial [Muribaculaceae bacterium]|nr:MATE family efflux transporter [Muribaculaceae bacterium]